MGDEPVSYSTLIRFHREVLVPDVERIVGDVVEGAERRLRDELQGAFDGVAKRLDRLEKEYHMLVAGLRRVEERLDSIEKRMALRSEVQALKAKVIALEEKLGKLESEL
jgi:predicted nuclease with TOPRIM domain